MSASASFSDLFIVPCNKMNHLLESAKYKMRTLSFANLVLNSLSLPRTCEEYGKGIEIYRPGHLTIMVYLKQYIVKGKDGWGNFTL